MWPFDRGGDVLRVGAQALELWRFDRGSRELVARHALAQRCSMYEARGLAEALGSTAALVERGSALLVFESALMPLILADTGGALWKPAQVEALLRHRFRLSYGGPGSDVDAWQVRTDFRFGERFALGYGMAPAVEKVIRDASVSAKLAWRGWLPALSWGIAQSRPEPASPRRASWFGWPEQDRMLLTRLQRGRVVALHPAAPLLSSAAEIESLVETQAQQGGVDPGELVCVASWEAGGSLPAPSARVEWRSIGARGTDRGAASLVALQPVPST